MLFRRFLGGKRRLDIFLPVFKVWHLSRRRKVDRDQAVFWGRLGTRIYTVERSYKVKVRWAWPRQIHCGRRRSASPLLWYGASLESPHISIASPYFWRYIGQFKQQYPSAKLIAPEEAVQKKVKEGLMFDGCTSVPLDHDCFTLYSYSLCQPGARIQRERSMDLSLTWDISFYSKLTSVSYWVVLSLTRQIQHW